jgi:hypothetical protein
MNFSSLVLFGLSAVATHQEFVAVRILIFCILIIFLIIAGIIVVISKKYIIHSAIPGWTSTMLSAFIIVLIQTLVISLFSFFLMLNNKGQKGVIPIKSYKDYILQIENGKNDFVANIIGHLENRINQ